MQACPRSRRVLRGKQTPRDEGDIAVVDSIRRDGFAAHIDAGRHIRSNQGGFLCRAGHGAARFDPMDRQAMAAR